MVHSIEDRNIVVRIRMVHRDHILDYYSTVVVEAVYTLVLIGILYHIEQIQCIKTAPVI